MLNKVKLLLDSQRKSLIVISWLVLSSFLGVLFFEGYNYDASVSAKTIIVDINGNGNYTSIQDAITNAATGDTIRVWSGWYNQSASITIGKSLTIIGNGTMNTTINGTGTGDVIRITTNYVTMIGFTIMNSGTGTTDAGIEIGNYNNIKIENCNLTKLGTGIYVNQGPNNKIINTTCNSNRYYGIYLYRSSDNQIINCTLNSNTHGIYAYWGSNRNKIINSTTNDNTNGIYISIISNNNIIRNCTSKLNTIGIYIYWRSVDNNIVNCTCNNNTNGISINNANTNVISNSTTNYNLLSGILFQTSNSNTVYNCNSGWNLEYGINLVSSQTNDLFNNTLLYNGFFISGNTVNYWNTHNIDTGNLVNNKPVYYITNQAGGAVTGNPGQLILANCRNVNISGFEFSNCSSGLLLGYSDYNNISNCISNYSLYGIYLYYSTNNLISNFTSSFNKDDGFYIYRSNDNILVNCTSNSNEYYGINIATVSDNTQILNCTTNNNNYGIYVFSSDQNIINNCECSMNLNDGIYLNNADNNIVNNCICDWNNNGINLFTSTWNIIKNNNIISNNESGIQLNNSDDNTLTENDILNNPIGINLASSTDQCQVVNTSVINSTNSEFRFERNSHAYALNCSLNWSKINFTDELSTLTVQWFMHVNVTNLSGYGLTGAQVIVFDNKSSFVYQGFTDAQGWCRWIPCSDYSRNATTIIDSFNTHNVSASQIKYEMGFAEPKPNINFTKDVKIVLIKDVTPPAPPDGLVFTTLGDKYLNFSWIQPIPADVYGYNIYINDTASSTTFHFIGTTTNLFYNATGLQEDVTYYFEVRAFDDVPLESTAIKGSNTTRDITPPIPPLNFIISEYGGHYLHLTWTSSPSIDVVGYEVWVNKSGSSTNFSYLATTTNLDYNHTGLVGETIYYYRLKAYDDIPLFSDFSFTIWGKTLDVTAPTAPTGLIAKNPTGDSITLQWLPNSELDLAGYHIYMNDTGAGVSGPYHKIHTIIGTKSQHTVTNLLEETTYHFVVVAYDYVPYDSPYSEPASATTLDVSAPTPPTGLNAEALSGSQIKLTWTANLENDINGYKIFINDTNTGPSGFFHEIHTLDGTGTNYTVNNLLDKTTYYFKIKAFDEIPHLSDFSNLASAKTKDVSPPKIPSGLKVIESTYDSLTLSWLANTELDLDGYFLYRSLEQNSGFSKINSEPMNDTKYVDTGLTEVTTYYYKLKAIDDSSLESGFSAVVSGTTLLGPHPPQIFFALDDFNIIEDTIDDSSINLYDWFRDINNDKLVFSCTGQNYIDVQIYQTNGTVVLTPEKDWNGIENLTFTASDGKFQISDDVLITVTPVNDAPGPANITSPKSGIRINDGTSLTFSGNCPDPDLPYDDELTFRWNSNISGFLGIGQTLTGVILSIGEHRISLEVTDKTDEKTEVHILVTVLETQESDSDNDGIPNTWERRYGFNPFDPSDAQDDADNDNLTNLEEYNYGTNPKSPDTDNDILTDYDEINKYNTDPLKSDSDNDTYSDGAEIEAGTDPNDPKSYPGADDKVDVEDLWTGLLLLGGLLCLMIIIIIITIVVAIIVIRRRSKKREMDARYPEESSKGIESPEFGQSEADKFTGEDKSGYDIEHEHEHEHVDEYEDWGKDKDKYEEHEAMDYESEGSVVTSFGDEQVTDDLAEPVKPSKSNKSKKRSKKSKEPAEDNGIMWADDEETLAEESSEDEFEDFEVAEEVLEENEEVVWD